MPSDSAPKIYVGDGSVLHSQGRLEPGAEFAVIVCGESTLQLSDSAMLMRPDKGGSFLSMVVQRDVYALVDVPEEDVKEVGFPDLFRLAESLRHRHPELTWHDKATVLRLFVFEGYWE